MVEFVTLSVGEKSPHPALSRRTGRGSQRHRGRQERGVSLHLEQVKKTYVGPDGSFVPVIDVDELAVADGEQVALIGTSGSGKTTLLHLIAGIVTPDSGRIVYKLGGGEGDVDLA